MARRRINYRFVTALAVGAFVALGLLAYVIHRVRRTHPEQFIAAAKEAEAAHHWSDAVSAMQKAVTAAPREPAYLTELGNDLHEYGKENLDAVRDGQDQAEWTGALVFQPDYVPAVASLYNYWRDVFSQSPGAASYQALRDRAFQFLRLAPDDPSAGDVKTFVYTATIQAYISGIETDADNLTDAENQVKALAAKSPASAALPYCLAELSIYRGQEIVRKRNETAQPASATAAYRQAADIMTKALKGQEKNAQMHYCASNVFAELGRVDQSSADVREADQEAARTYMDQAVALVSPGDQQFSQISVAACRAAMEDKDDAKAHKIAERLVKERGTDPGALVMAMPILEQMADLRPGVIESLEKMLSEEQHTAEVTLRRFNLLVPLVDLQICELADAKDAAKKTQLRDAITAHLSEMDNANLNPLWVVEEKARMAEAQQDFITAIQVMTAGMAADRRIAADTNLMWMLALSYDKVGESAEALDYCNRVVQADPTNLAARKMLVQLLSGEGTGEEVRRQISQQLNYLERAAPDDPQVIGLEMTQLDRTNDADQIKALYNRLPEKTPQEMLEKARVSTQLPSGTDDAIRLLRLAMQADPKNANVAIGLSYVYGSVGKKADAIATIQQALALMPDDESLQLALKRLQNASPEQLAAMKLALDQQTADPVTRELKLASDAMDANNEADFETHVAAAEKIAPTNPDVMRLSFQIDLNNKKWDKAEEMAQALGKINADQAKGLIFEFTLAQYQQDVPKQLSIAQQLTTTMPEFAMSYYCLAQADQAAGKYDDAINNYGTALQKKGVDAQAAQWLKQKINCYYKVNRPEQALQAIVEGCTRYPTDPEFMRMKILHEAGHGDPDDAATDLMNLQQYLQDELTRPNQDPKLPEQLAETYLDLSNARMQISINKLRDGEQTEATGAANAAIAELRDGLVKFPDDDRMYEKLSEELRYTGDPTGAEQALLDLQNRPAWAHKAQPLILLGEFYSAMYPTFPASKAENAYTQALALASDSERALVQVQLAAVLSGEKKTDPALAVLAQADEKDPRIHMERVNVLVEAGRQKDAEDEIAKIGSQDPKMTSDLETGWATMELKAGRLSTAAAHIAKALAANPQNVTALVTRARLEASQNPPDINSALADLNSARGVDPNNADVLILISDIDLDRQQYADAEKAMEQALQIDPTKIDLRERMAYYYCNYQPENPQRALKVLQDGLNQPGGDTNADLFNDLATVFQQLGQPNQALTMIGNAMNRIPGNLVLIRSYLRLNLETKNYQEVIDKAGTVIQQVPDLWWAWQLRGEAYAKLGDKTSAMSDLLQALNAAATDKRDPTAQASVVESISRDVDTQKAIDLVKQKIIAAPAPQKEEWEYILILLYHQVGQDDDAIKLLVPLMAEAEKLPPAARLPRLQLAGSIYSTASPQPMAQQAYDTYKELLSINVNDVQALNNFACVCADEFNPPKVEEGLAAIRRAMDLLSAGGTSDPSIEDSYGWLLILSGQTTEGMDVIHKAVARAELPEAYYHLGEGYLRLNQPQEAQRQVNLALQAIAKAQAANQPVSASTRAKVRDLAGRILDSLRTGANQVPAGVNQTQP